MILNCKINCIGNAPVILCIQCIGGKVLPYGDISTMPEIPGLMLWKSGHAGVYIGGGYAIEAMGTRKGVVKTEVSDRGWQGWGKLPYINYLEEK